MRERKRVRREVDRKRGREMQSEREERGMKRGRKTRVHVSEKGGRLEREIWREREMKKEKSNHYLPCLAAVSTVFSRSPLGVHVLQWTHLEAVDTGFTSLGHAVSDKYTFSKHQNYCGILAGYKHCNLSLKSVGIFTLFYTQGQQRSSSSHL